jgi:2'-5' RNA ligase
MIPDTAPGPRTVGVSIGLPEPFCSELADWRERLGDPSAAKIPPHITLLPPTSLEDDVVDKFESHLAAVAASHPPFQVRLVGSGTFLPVSPVVFVTVAEGAAACGRVAAEVHAGPVKREIHFAYHPHVTVAHDLPAPQLDQAIAALADYSAEFDAASFALFERNEDGYWQTDREFTFGQVR